jgi:hypothetical protein
VHQRAACQGIPRASLDASMVSIVPCDNFPCEELSKSGRAQLIAFTLNGKAAYVSTDNATEHPVRRGMDGYSGRQRLTP